MNFFYILSGPLGYVMEWIYKLLPSYGWDIIIFTLLINIVKIPLQLSQQKSMAKMSAFQPMMMEIQTKYKDKPEKQQEEMLKLQQNYGYNPTAGCVPMLLNFLVMFGVIGVVYNPLERIFHISAAALTAAGEALTASGVAFTAITRDTNIIAQVVAGNGGVLGCFSAEQIATITEFSQHMNFLGIDLTRIPKLGLSLDIVLPLLSVITMLLSTHISMKASGQQMQGSMKVTMWVMNLMFVFGVVGMIAGSVNAIFSHDLRRMVAFSSVAQIGYIYAGLGLGTNIGFVAAIYHMLMHACAKSALFISSSGLADASGNSKRFSDLRGAGFRNPAAGVCFSVAAMSLVGIPVLGGFISKLYLSNAALDRGGLHMWVMLIALAVSTLLNVLYFMKTVITLYRPPRDGFQAPAPERSPLSSGAMWGFVALNLLVGLMAQPIVTAITNGLMMFE